MAVNTRKNKVPQSK